MGRIKMFASLILLVTLFVCVGTAQNVYKQPSFTATFPAGEIKFSAEDGKSAEGQTITLNTWGVSVNDDTYVAVMYSDYATARANTVENLDLALGGESSVFEEGTLVQEKFNANIGRLPGRGIRATGTLKAGGKAYLYSRVAVIGNRLWQVMYLSLVPVTEDVALPFLNSIIIN